MENACGESGCQVLWSEGDQIILVKQSDVSITTVYTLSEGAGSTSGTFAGATLTDGEYMAYYAYDRNQPLKFGEQTSNSEQFVSHAPMTAIFTVSGAKLRFPAGGLPGSENQMGVIGYYWTGTETPGNPSYNKSAKTMYGHSFTYENYSGSKEYKFSVRLIHDMPQ